MDKYCPECKRGIAVKIIDTCAYCGADLPKEFCLSDEEKQLIKLKRAEEDAKRAARRKAMNAGVGSIGGGSGFDFGGDCGGDC